MRIHRENHPRLQRKLRFILGTLLILLPVAPLLAEDTSTRSAASLPEHDWRNIRTGRVIPDEGYCDQPYVVITADGSWLCTLTTGPGQEGQAGQHVASTNSGDQGQTWSPLVAIEPADGPEASWVVPLVTPGGRVYAFYSYNGEQVDHLPGDSRKIRADTIGWYCFKYSDDLGRTWSKQRYRLPMRLTACDRTNDWQGKVQIFWGIDKPKFAGASALFSFTKLGRYMLDDGEGWIYRSDNLLTELNAEKIQWELLPDGEQGIRAAEFGSVQEEHNHIAINDNRLTMVYRTTRGFPCQSTSADRGRTWTPPEPMVYRPGGRKIKTPRACPKLWRCKNGKYLFWFHNHGGHTYKGRNPAWLSGGEVRRGKMHWSQPEIVLYDQEPETRMSYPDLIEQNGRYWIAETQKTVARIHEIDATLLEGLWRQDDLKLVARSGLILETTERSAKLPAPLDLVATGGVSLDFWLTLGNLSPGQILIDTRAADGRGIVLRTVEHGAVKIELADGHATAAWDSDPGLLKSNQRHHLVAIVDSAPQIITLVVDGILCDGGDARQYGWGRYAGPLGNVTGSGQLQVAPAVEIVRIYRRYLRTSEAVGNFQAGPPVSP